MPKRGDVREDGKIFWCKQKACANGERWVSLEQFEEYSKKNSLAKKRAYEKNKDKVIARSKAWKEANRERVNESARRCSKTPEARAKRLAYYYKWLEKNPDKAAKYKKTTRERHKEKLSERYKEWYRKNITVMREKRRNYWKQHPERAAERDAKRRGEIIFTSQEERRKIAELVRQTRRLTKCTGFMWHLDHIIPLHRGGPHSFRNLQPIPAFLNLSKGSKMPTERTNPGAIIPDGTLPRVHSKVYECEQPQAISI